MDDILYLEPDEEITAAIEKISGADGKLIGLVIPKGAALIQSVVNLKLIKAKAKELKKNVAIITADAVGRNLAAQLEIPVYDNVKQAKPTPLTSRAAPAAFEVIEVDPTSATTEKLPGGIAVHRYERDEGAYQSHDKDSAAQTEPPPFRRKEIQTVQRSVGSELPNKVKTIPAPLPLPPGGEPRLKSPKPPGKKWPWVVGALGAVLAGIVVVFSLVPQATINIVVASEPFEKTIALNVGAAGADAIPPVYAQKSESGEKTVQTTGTKNIGEKAKGTLQLFNSWSSDAIEIAINSTLAAGGKKYVTTTAATIPGAEVALQNGQLITTPGKTTVAVEATAPGEDYNTAAGTSFSFFDFTGDKGQKIYGEAAAALSGGSTKTLQVVAQKDLDEGLLALEQELNNKIDAAFTKENPKAVFPDDGKKTERQETSSSQDVNAEAGEVTVKLTIIRKLFGYDSKTYQEALKTLLNKSVPAGKTVVLGEGSELKTTTKDLNLAAKTMIVETQVVTRIAAEFDTASFKKSLRGRSPQKVNTLLAGRSDIKGSAVTFTPAWWPPYLLPWRISRIKLDITYE